MRKQVIKKLMTAWIVLLMAGLFSACQVEETANISGSMGKTEKGEEKDSSVNEEDETDGESTIVDSETDSESETDSDSEMVSESAWISDSSQLIDDSDLTEEEKSMLKEAAEQIWDYCRSMAEEDMEALEENKEYDITYHFAQDADFDQFAFLYKFTPKELGNYTFTMSDIDTEKETFVYCNLVDSDTITKLELSNLEGGLAQEDLKKDEVAFDSQASGDAFCVPGETYYALVFACPVEEKELDGSFKLTVKKSENEWKCQDLTEDKAMTATMKNLEDNVVGFVPEKTGYYGLDAQVKTKAEGHLVVYSVLDEEGQEIEEAYDNIFYLEQGKKYYIYYGLEEANEEEVEIELKCYYISAGQEVKEGSYDMKGYSVFIFKPEKTGEYLIYSTSETNPDAIVYDENGDIVGQGADMNNQLYSKNKKDFALLLDAEAGQKYYIGVEVKGQGTDEENDAYTVTIELE